MLSTDAIKYFKESGFKVKQSENELIISHGRSGQYFIAGIGCLLSITCLFIATLTPVFGLLLFVVVILITLSEGSKSRGKSNLKIDNKKRTFDSTESRWGRMKRPVSEIDEMGIKTDFIDEYTTATKSTSKEYHHTIFITLATGHTIDLFSFAEDYKRPSKEFNETYLSLKFLFKELKRN